jgi:hypothetical protein
MTRLIGLAGPAQSGKSTTADAITSFGYTRLRFADPIKRALRAILEASGMTPATITRHLDGDLKEAPLDVLEGRTARYAMQTLGTEWGRELIGPNLWVNITMSLTRKILSAGGNVVIDDVRFWEEVGAIRDLQGMMIEITRPGVSYNSSHKSEDGLNGFELSLDNTGSEQDLHRKIQQIIAGS